MSSQRRPWWYRVLWRMSDDRGRGQLLLGDVARARSAYLGTVLAFQRADLDWTAWETAAVYDEHLVALRSVPARRRVDIADVPAVDPLMLVGDMDAAFDVWKCAFDAAAAHGATPEHVAVPDDWHLDAVRRAASPDGPATPPT